jgi:hypothetical protein
MADLKSSVAAAYRALVSLLSNYNVCLYFNQIYLKDEHRRNNFVPKPYCVPEQEQTIHCACEGERKALANRYRNVMQECLLDCLPIAKEMRRWRSSRATRTPWQRRDTHQTSELCKRESPQTLTLLWPRRFLPEWRGRGSVIYDRCTLLGEN